MAATESLPLMVNEDYHTIPLTNLITVWGVPILATPKAWMSVVSLAPLMLIATVFFIPNATFLERVVATVVWTLLFFVTSCLHSFGHIVGGKLAGSPMNRLIITSTRHVNIYDGDQDSYPPRVHLLRAGGGPVMNILIGLLTTAIIIVGTSTPALLLFALMNLAFGFGALAPIPSVDGEVIARYLFRR